MAALATKALRLRDSGFSHCSCPARSECSHILAAALSVSAERVASESMDDLWKRVGA